MVPEIIASEVKKLVKIRLARGKTLTSGPFHISTSTIGMDTKLTPMIDLGQQKMIHDVINIVTSQLRTLRTGTVGFYRTNTGVCFKSISFVLLVCKTHKSHVTQEGGQCTV